MDTTVKMIQGAVELVMRIICFGLGFLIMAVGIALLARCKVPMAPMNPFPRELAEIYHRELRQFKLWFNLCCVAFTLLVSLYVHRLVGVGIGTLVEVLTSLITGVII